MFRANNNIKHMLKHWNDLLHSTVVCRLAGSCNEIEGFAL